MPLIVVQIRDNFVPPILFTLRRIASPGCAVICLTRCDVVAVCGLPGVARPRPHRCDKIQPHVRAEPTCLAPNCTLA
jgi:hypothetical protein